MEDQIRAVVFDRDGTLLRYDEEWLLAQLQQAWPPLTLEVLNSHWGRHAHLMPATPEGEPEFWLTLWTLFVAAHGGTAADAEELARLAGGYHGAFHPYADTHDCLNWLRGRGIRLSVLTNHPMVSVAATLRNANVDPGWFDALINAYPRSKPDPAAYAKVLTALDLAPQECLLIDDEPANVRGALEVGMRAVLLDRDNRHADDHLPKIYRLDEIGSATTLELSQ
ncbi:HAD family hydrolase [Lentzea sp. NPDC051213]|uniref:HAD family hydrolase n=1 Tax=Lentzea sp. NPDC051213 TaxID=3364126 RepID=UPI0037938258